MEWLIILIRESKLFFTHVNMIYFYFFSFGFLIHYYITFIKNKKIEKIRQIEDENKFNTSFEYVMNHMELYARYPQINFFYDLARRMGNKQGIYKQVVEKSMAELNEHTGQEYSKIIYEKKLMHLKENYQNSNKNENFVNDENLQDKPIDNPQNNSLIINPDDYKNVEEK